MGVRGLTSFVARNAEIYLQPYELHDCNLVIDGDNLACSLYKDVTGTYSAFGGDYDDYYRAVLNVFHVLAECNIHAYVLMDGGYEAKKLRTVGKRLRGKIAVIKRINPCGSIPVFPVMMKEVFVDAVRDSGVPVMRCIFEADEELAALSRKLNCPVLSYDSDFYIHNVRYIPLITLTVKAHTKRLQHRKEMDQNGLDSVSRKMRQNEAKKFQKRTKANRILSEIQVDAVEKHTSFKGKSYKYLDCCIYKIENLIGRESLSKDKLPLFAALLGNDYISSSSFKNFFASVGKSKRNRKLKQQQRRIITILHWLKHETAQSALQKVMARLRMNQRESILAQVNAAISGYSNERCLSYDYFKANCESAFVSFPETEENEIYQSEDEGETVESSEYEESEDEDEDEDEDNASEENANSINDSEENVSEENNDVVSAEEIELNSEDNEHLPQDYDDEEDANDDIDTTIQFPAWFLEKLYPANLPRFFVDLMHLRKYINNPQIEHFPHNDCHEIALPILIYIYTLLHNVQGEETPTVKAEDGTDVPIEFTYLTRATRVTNIRYYRYPIASPPSYAFDPRAPNPLLLRHVFTNSMHEIDSELLFTQLQLLPADLHLYFLAIVYWLQKSQHCDLLHLHALIVCLVVLRTIDTKIPVERDLRAFQKRFGKIIKKERLVRDKEASEGVKRGVKEGLKALPIPERMPFIPKSDCLLVQDHLLKHFHMQELFKKKYDLYSTTVLHAFAEFQALVFQLHALNALLNFPLPGVHMGQLYCGVFLYNVYDLLRDRLDIRYHVQHFIFNDSQMMYDFYIYLLDWCEQFVPDWKRLEQQSLAQSVNKKVMKKRRQAERKKATKAEDPNVDMLEEKDEVEDDFFDLNNKFCTLKICK